MQPCNLYDSFVARSRERILGKERFSLSYAAAAAAAVSQNKAEERRLAANGTTSPPPGGETHNNGVLFLASLAAQINVFGTPQPLQTVSDGGRMGPAERQ